MKTSHHINGFWFHINWESKDKGRDQHGNIWFNKENPTCDNKLVTALCNALGATIQNAAKLTTIIFLLLSVTLNATNDSLGIKLIEVMGVGADTVQLKKEMAWNAAMTMSDGDFAIVKSHEMKMNQTTFDVLFDSPFFIPLSIALICAVIYSVRLFSIRRFLSLFIVVEDDGEYNFAKVRNEVQIGNCNGCGAAKYRSTTQCDYCGRNHF